MGGFLAYSQSGHLRRQHAFDPGLFFALPLAAQTTCPVQDRADRFLALVNANYQALATVQQQAQQAVEGLDGRQA